MIAQSVADILSDHVRLKVEGIDRMYLNVYVPGCRWNKRLRGFSESIVASRYLRRR
jgi:hypothetical protein